MAEALSEYFVAAGTAQAVGTAGCAYSVALDKAFGHFEEAAE